MTSKRYTKEMVNEEGGFQKNGHLPEVIERRRAKNKRRREESEERRQGINREQLALNNLRECEICHIKTEEVNDYAITGIKCRLRAVTRKAELPLCPGCFHGVNECRVDVIEVLGENVFQVVGPVRAELMISRQSQQSDARQERSMIKVMLSNPRLDKYRE